MVSKRNDFIKVRCRFFFSNINIMYILNSYLFKRTYEIFMFHVKFLDSVNKWQLKKL